MSDVQCPACGRDGAKLVRQEFKQGRPAFEVGQGSVYDRQATQVVNWYRCDRCHKLFDIKKGVKR
jgi:hypothetical protein